jgi:AraC-like DNA-binding protein
MQSRADLLDEIRHRISVHARPDMRTAIDGLLLSRVTTDAVTPDYTLTDPLLVLMAQGGKRLLLGDRTYEYRAGQCLVVTATVPVTGHHIDTSVQSPSLGLGLVLRPADVAELILQGPAGSRARSDDASAISTGDAGVDLLDAMVRMLRLLDNPTDAAVLAPLVQREILWRTLTGPQGAALRNIGLADSNLSHVSRAITWVRDNYAEPVRIDDLAQLAGLSTSAFHRHFRAVTAMTPLQFQKRIRLQHARSLLLAQRSDVAAVGHEVGYDSPSQFNREYRRLFGAPPGRDASRLRDDAGPVAHLV